MQKTKPAVVEVVALNAQNEQIRSGTGFFISSDGNLLTANSLINGASSIAAKTPTGAAYSLKRIVFTSKNPDVAELNFSATNVAHLDLGSCADLVEGQHVLVISNPDSAQGTISEGLVSAFPENRSLAQITAPLSISSTGSPVIDESGNVIGLAVQTEKEGQKISLAIAAESIKNLLANPPAKIAATPQQQAPSKTAATPQQKAAHPGYGLAYDDTPDIVRFMTISA